MNLKMHPTLIALPAMLLAGLLLVAIGCEGGKTPTQLISEQFDGMVAPSPSEAARDAFNVYDPDKRRRAVVLLSNASWGGEPPYIRTYRLLVDDPDPTVRAAAVSALGRHGDRTDVDRITNRLTTDDNRIVRWEAAKALQKMHTDKAIAPLLAGLKDDDRDVRAASATALGQYPQRSVFDALVGALTDEDYGVVIAARDSLRTLTGQNFGDRGSAWWEWAEDNQQVFAEKQTYHYPQYDAPPGLLSFGQDETPEPQRPRMVEELALIDTDNMAIAGADETPEAAPPIVTRDPEPQPDPAPVVRREPAPQPQPEPTPTPTVTRTPEPEPQPAPVVTRDPEPAETVTGTGTSVTVSPPQPEPADTQPEPEPTADATPEPRPEATSTTSSTAVVVEETAPASDDLRTTRTS